MKEKPNVCLFLGCLELKDILDCLPSEEFELTANTLQAHMKPHGKLILKPLIYLTAHSSDDLTAVTFL